MAVIDQKITEEYALYNGDSCEILPSFPDESIHFCIYSPPFALESGGCLFNYSSSPRDLSNANTYVEFFEHYEYIVSEIARILLPGRICAVHCMDIPRAGASIAGHSDFPGDIIRLHIKHGFIYTPRICIWKEPLAVRNRTMAKALAHYTIVEDSTLANVAAADYLIPFRKRGENPIPVTHPHGFMEYAGGRDVPGDLKRFRGWTGKQTENLYSHWIWRHYASCFWDDIRMSKFVEYKRGRDEEDEEHLHPLQLDVIDRSCMLWTNPGESVLSPFAGVGSEVFGAVSNGRKGIGIELKSSYYQQAVKNCKEAANRFKSERIEGFF